MEIWGTRDLPTSNLIGYFNESEDFTSALT